MTEEVFPRYKHTEVRDMDQIISFWEEKQRILSTYLDSFADRGSHGI